MSETQESNETLEPTCKNARQCGICGAPADRYASMYQCQAHPGHIGDLVVGIFSDCTYPEEK